MIKAVIFDLDGVLADACEIHRQALNQALEEVVGYRIPDDELPKYEGLPTKNKLLLMSVQGLVSHDKFDAINARKQELTLELLEEGIHYSTPIVQMMRRLQLANVDIAVVTNCTERSARIMLTKLGVLHFIRTLVTSEDVEHPKPDPQGLKMAMYIMEVQPHEVLYIGDTPLDAKAAHNARIDMFLHVNSPNEVCWELLRCKILGGMNG